METECKFHLSRDTTEEQFLSHRKIENSSSEMKELAKEKESDCSGDSIASPGG